MSTASATIGTMAGNVQTEQPAEAKREVPREPLKNEKPPLARLHALVQMVGKASKLQQQQMIQQQRQLAQLLSVASAGKPQQDVTPAASSPQMPTSAANAFTQVGGQGLNIAGNKQGLSMVPKAIALAVPLINPAGVLPKPTAASGSRGSISVANPALLPGHKLLHQLPVVMAERAPPLPTAIATPVSRQGLPTTVNIPGLPIPLSRAGHAIGGKRKRTRTPQSPNLPSSASTAGAQWSSMRSTRTSSMKQARLRSPGLPTEEKYGRKRITTFLWKQLRRYLQKLDEDKGNQYLSQIRSLSAPDLLARLRSAEEIIKYLNLAEFHELQRSRDLAVLHRFEPDPEQKVGNSVNFAPGSGSVADASERTKSETVTIFGVVPKARDGPHGLGGKIAHGTGKSGRKLGKSESKLDPEISDKALLEELDALERPAPRSS